MDEMEAKYGPRGLTVIAVNLDKDEGKIKEFLSATHPRFTIAYDPEGTVAEHYKVTGMPSSYLIGRDGTLQVSHVGFRDKDKAVLERQIVELLAESQGEKP
jgi:peroxiredoxin